MLLSVFEYVISVIWLHYCVFGFNVQFVGIFVWMFDHLPNTNKLVLIVVYFESGNILSLLS